MFAQHLNYVRTKQDNFESTVSLWKPEKKGSRFQVKLLSQFIPFTYFSVSVVRQLKKDKNLLCHSHLSTMDTILEILYLQVSHTLTYGPNLIKNDLNVASLLWIYSLCVGAELYIFC